MKWHIVFLLLMGMTWRVSNSTCVFESDFGFTLNCAFKKSSIFRVRNLGGVKGYVGLGFSLGDELGFKQSLSTLESNRRRSTDGQGAGVANGVQQSVASKRGDTGMAARSHKGKQSGRQVIPPFKPLPPPGAMGGGMPGGALRTVPAPMMNQGGYIAVPAFAALPQSIVRIPNVNTNKQQSVQVTPRPQAPANFQNALQMANRRFQVVDNSPNSNAISPNTLSIRTLPSQSSSKPTYSVSGVDIYAPSPLLMGHSIYSLSQASNISVPTLTAAIKLRQEQLKTSTSAPLSTAVPTSTTTTTTVPTPTQAPTVRPKYTLSGKHKVMNAPKEYYPVSYDKNYDDNFTSKVELPDTSFSCGDQKHFPGLYADEDLGCMVFHVCAFTDDGLVQKSFLCPESTLFDQTILKCNWWFYVDCKSSKKLYDSNIPISKSYQLMKALAFFSSYRNQSSNAT